MLPRLIAVRNLRPLQFANRVNKRVFTLSAFQLNEPLKQTRLADIKDNIYTLPNALCLARSVLLQLFQLQLFLEYVQRP
jgi:hypothetical protein